jgi:hypothetical protein
MIRFLGKPEFLRGGLASAESTTHGGELSIEVPGMDYSS